MSYQNQNLLVGEAVACRRSGALVNKGSKTSDSDVTASQMSTWLELQNDMIRSEAKKCRVERRRWDATLWNAWFGFHGLRRQSREEDHLRFAATVNPSWWDGTTTAASAAPSQETTSRETTQSVAERTRVRPAETEAEGAPQVQRTRTAVSVPGTATTGMTSETTTTSPARALVERVGNEAGEDSQPVQMRRIVALMAECEDTTATEAVAEARQKKLGKIHQCQSPRRSHQSRASHRRDHQTLDRTMGGQCARWQRVEGQVGDARVPSKLGTETRTFCRRRQRWGTSKWFWPVQLWKYRWWQSGTAVEPSTRAGTWLLVGICVSIPWMDKCAPRAWDTYSAKLLTISMKMEQPRYDGGLLHRFEPRGEHLEEKSVRHIDDFLVTGANRT